MQKKEFFSVLSYLDIIFVYPDSHEMGAGCCFTGEVKQLKHEAASPASVTEM
jgi:hypothetical protein